jgi:hypothetical protein
MVFILIDEAAPAPVVQAPGLAAEVLADESPCPRVGLTLTGLSPTSESTVTVWKTVPGEARVAVRGLRNVRVVDSHYVDDFEVPLGRPVTYTLEVSGPVVPATLVVTVTVPSDKVWIQDPLDPTSAVGVAIHRQGADVYMTSTALRSISRPTSGSRVEVMGADYPTLLGGGRRGAQGVPLDIGTRSVTAAGRVRDLLNAASPLLVRTTPEISQIPALSYVDADVEELPLTMFIDDGAQYRLTRWAITGDLVQPPSMHLLVPTWTYDEVSALYETYDAAAALGRTYLEMLRDPTP